jgi:ParB-like chromosome segregation protein Spo0J
MTNNLRHSLLKHVQKPRISIRPIRRNSPEYAELLESVRKDGVLQPILTRPLHCIGCSHKTCIGADCTVPKDESDETNTVEGWHRLEASRETGQSTIPIMEREMSDKEVLIVQIKCNAIRPLTATFEYARRLKLLMEDHTLPELSALIDKTPRWIQNQIQLNRLCESARPPVERGEIKMTAALALANLPEELQPKFVEDAVAMKAVDFKERAELARRDFQTYLLQEQQSNRETGAARPTLRTLNVLKREAVKPKNAQRVLKAMKAKTPLQGWEACLAWLFKLDPDSCGKRKARYEEKHDEALASNSEYRQLNRDMIEKFVNPESLLGEHRNGE